MTAALLIKREIARRINWTCQADLKRGKVLSMIGDSYANCADCHSPCERSDQASGITGNSLKFEVIVQNDKSVKLFWPCPGCGHDISEGSALLDMERKVVEIESDPLCFTCRTKKAA